MTMLSLATNRLLLRPPEPRDSEDLVETIVDPGIMRMMGTIPSQYKRAHADAFIARARDLQSDGPECLFAITRSNRLIGIIRVDPRGGHRFIAYWIARTHWGQGLMSEALPAIIAYYFATREVAEIYADYFVDNVVSKRILEKNGFEKVGEQTVHSHYRNEDVLEICTLLTRERFMQLGHVPDKAKASS